MSLPSVLLYARQGCHLCEQAHAILVAHGLEPQQIDIDADAQLRERFGACVPVVFIDGRERFRGRVNPVLLKRMLGK